MNRRGFLASLLAGAAGTVLPEEPRRVYSFPPRPTIWTPPWPPQHFNSRCAAIPFGSMVARAPDGGIVLAAAAEQPVGIVTTRDIEESIRASLLSRGIDPGALGVRVTIDPFDPSSVFITAPFRHVSPRFVASR